MSTRWERKKAAEQTKTESRHERAVRRNARKLEKYRERHPGAR